MGTHAPYHFPLLRASPKQHSQPSADANMPREDYQLPTAAARGSTNVGSNTDVRSVMTYLCGDCGGSVSLGKDALVACPHCAGRVLYKERTKRMVQFEAR